MSVPEPQTYKARVGILLLSHGPLADALKETVRVLEPDERQEVHALSLAWDEAPDAASRRLEKAITAADAGAGGVLLTDMFGGTPSNLALAFLDPGRLAIVTGVNLPMVVKARALARAGTSAREISSTLVARGRRAIVAAAELLAAKAVP
jgi:PTS system mannose-specific IIA component